MSAEPHRDACAGGTGVDPGVRNGVPTAIERDVLIGPQPAHHFDLFGRAHAAGRPVLVKADELRLVPADADAEPKSAAGQDIDTGGLLGDQDRLALGQDQDLYRKPDALGCVREKSEQDEWIVEVVRRCVAVPARPARGVDTEDVVGGAKMIIAERFRRLGVGRDRCRITADVTQRQTRP